MTGSYRIAVDTGGTFTDVVVADDQARLTFNKALTTPERMFDGARAALALIAEELGLELGELLGRSELLIYGTTRATNAIVEGKTARTAFLTTRGFPDILSLREGGKLEPFNFALAYPPPYVPRALTYEIGGRIDAQGDEVAPLDEDDVRDALAAATSAGVDAVAVCLIWSLANPAHERRVGELIEECMPGVPYTLSYALNPTIREYRRASSTAIDASLKPLMQRHFADIHADLEREGFAGDLLVVTSSGGCLHVDEVRERPIYSVNSGPSMAPLAAHAYAQLDDVAGDLVVCDTGGTTFDVSLVQDGRIRHTRETWLGPRFQGHITGLSSVDVTSIGSGGGSIAWIDGGGLLRVGPRSAGSDPGPACYGRGGAEPTVSDAAVVLGYLDPEHFLGGRMQLDGAAAEEAIRRRVAEPLGLDLDRAAAAIVAVSNETMVAAIREITIKQGVDPRECTLVAGGGAGGMLAAGLAEAMGAAAVLVPRTAGAFSACGAHFADIVTEFTMSGYTSSAEFDFDAVNATLEALGARIDDFAARMPSHLVRGLEREFAVEARYPSQVWELEVPLDGDRVVGGAGVEQIVERFHAIHRRTFAVAEEGQDVECQYWRGRLTARLPRAAGGSGPRAAAPAGGAVRAERPVRFGDAGRLPAAVLRGGALTAGFVAAGPLVVQEPTTTVVVPPGARLTVTRTGNYLIELEEGVR
jgi:N-methylhydantoinase A